MDCPKPVDDNDVCDVQEKKEEARPDPFNVYVSVIYGGTSDMRISPGAALGVSVGDEEVTLNTEGRFTGDPSHLWPIAPPSPGPTKVSPNLGTDSFAASTTVRLHLGKHADLGGLFGAGIAIEEIAQPRYVNTGLAGVLEAGVEIFRTRAVGFEGVLRADIPAFSVRTSSGPSHAPMLTGALVLRF